jgi:glycosyltransferase involved in cell wall biosynthesis
MKILVYAHRLEWGGTQVNAIELSAYLRARFGHDVVLVATPGPMLDFAIEKKLRFIPVPDAHVHPSLGRMRALRDAVRREQPDVIHAWDWWQCLDAYFAVHLPHGIPMLVSDMTMTVSRFLPKTLMTTFGTPELVERACEAGRRRVDLLVPPVDVAINAPGAVDPLCFRRKHAVRPDEVLLVTVSRLVKAMKSEGLYRTIDAVGQLGTGVPLRYLIVGDGDAKADLQVAADKTNARLGRQAVVLVGPLLDPRQAYAAADIVVGMGGSALRGMAFAKPVIVVGERGFAMPFHRATAADFYYTGMYGLGSGSPDNAALAQHIREWAFDARIRERVGTHSRHFVVERFALEAVGDKLDALLRSTAAQAPRLGAALLDGCRTVAVHWGRQLLPSDIRRLTTRSSRST